MSIGCFLAYICWTQQYFFISLAQVARNWKFAAGPKSIARMENAEMLPNAKLADFGRILDSDGYAVRTIRMDDIGSRLQKCWGL